MDRDKVSRVDGYELKSSFEVNERVNMRLIQFNSGLRVVLKDVQPHQAEPHQRYYLAAAPLPLPHHSSNSSIATTSSSIKSNGSTSTNAEYYIHRPYPAGSQSTVYYQYAHMKTPSVANATPASSLTVEVGRVQSNRSRWLTSAVSDLRARAPVCVCSRDRHVGLCLTLLSLMQNSRGARRTVDQSNFHLIPLFSSKLTVRIFV